MLSSDFTITRVGLEQSGTDYFFSEVDLLVPIFYSDDNVALAFDLPLVQASLFLDLGNLEPGARGSIRLEGALRAVDAMTLSVERPGESFTLFRVLQASPLDVDTTGDGENDAWRMRWIGTTDLM